MEASRKKALLIDTVQALMRAKSASFEGANTLSELMVVVSKAGLDSVRIAMLMMIRGSKIDDGADGIIAHANKLTAEEGYSPAFEGVCRAIDEIT
ncbi:hypothetical protein CL628_03865 [bacterium]|nr:hypothetical protein [bacterium]|tara:strand:+ start:202 stop:486 length:285 start_codon:yes stop_codon:yes gene_type:complete